MTYRSLNPGSLPKRTRYHLITSLVVPRPIGWISTWSEDGQPNLAPFSYFTALSADPMLVGISIGHRSSGPKDTLVNLRARGAFCANVADVAHLEAMNTSSAEVGPDVDEFELAGLSMETSSTVDAPYVPSVPAVLECTVFKEVDLGGAPNTFVIGEVVGLLLREDLPFVEGTHAVDTGVLNPVGRLWGKAYALPGDVRILPRPS